MARKRDEAAFERKRTQIMRAAEALFIERGFHQTGMAAICDAAGMQPGALYRYFPSKADLIAALVAEERDETQAFLARLDGASDLRSALVEALMEAVAAVGEADYGRLALEIAAEGAREERVGALLADAEIGALTHLTRILEGARAAGQIDKSCDCPVAAALLLTLIDGATGSDLHAGFGERLRPVLRGVVDGILDPSPSPDV
ncbi:MAG: helix-turn-helix domain-containing protein [Pseudomonadota bacterium]